MTHAKLGRLVAAALILSPIAPAAAQIRIVQHDAPIEPAGSPLPLVEPFAAVDPSDSDHIVVGAIVAPTTDGSPWRCATFTTFDRGGAWTRRDFDMERCIDPWIIFPGDDAALFTGIEIQSGYEGTERFHLVSYHSDDGGLTWPDEPVSLGRTHDHELLATTASSESVYITSQRTHPGLPPHVYVGRLGVPPRNLIDLATLGADSLSSKPSGIAEMSDGSLVVTYEEYHPVEDSAHVSHVRAARITPDGVEGPFRVTDGCDVGKSGFPGYPFLARDASNGAHRGRLYHACILPDLSGVGLSHSDSGGRTWSRLTRVDDGEATEATSESARGRPDRGRTHVRTPMLAVSSDGVIGLAWYDRRNDPERLCQDVYFTASSDGGATFVPPRRVSTETSCPGAPGNGRAGRSWPMGGDYSSLAAGPDGSFHLFWADSRTGHFQLRYAEIRFGG